MFVFQRCNGICEKAALEQMCKVEDLAKNMAFSNGQNNDPRTKVSGHPQVLLFTY